ncbi:MGMT family protein [Penicillium hetheringtonii]|uniref:MGMT family protein n=1 Tax=Penicillium hetheringtonii TaxID=911720 RepID=A0AAD6E572_9EURO|nr:MGMT family protein [Penicillium hetheringtonii]
MPRSEEAEAWSTAVYAAIQEIPRGKVTSYGHIALLLGERMPLFSASLHTSISTSPILTRPTAQRPRQVGTCLKALPSDLNQPYTSENVPWQRVINSKGMISHRGPGSAERQAEVLRGGGVEVKRDAMGEFYVDFSRFGWFPSELPSEVDDTIS